MSVREVDQVYRQGSCQVLVNPPTWAVGRNFHQCRGQLLTLVSIVHAFDAWAATPANRERVEKSMPIAALSNSVIGVDAAYYLEGAAREPLVSALGGFPLALESTIVRELKDWQAVGIRPHFVFNGLDDGINDDPFGPSLASARANATAFETYDRDEASQAIELFRNSGKPIKCPRLPIEICQVLFQEHPLRQLYRHSSKDCCTNKGSHLLWHPTAPWLR